MSRSSYYYAPCPVSEADLRAMRLIDETYTLCPFYGSRRMRVILHEGGIPIGRDHVRRLMRIMRLEPIYPKRNLSKAAAEHRKFPYLLRGVQVKDCDHVWSTDITYIRLAAGFVYLTAVIDWASRRVFSWRLSNTLDVDFCLEALEEALSHGTPAIFNTDQGCQFTCRRWIDFLQSRSIAISMDGKGRATDNAICERLWRSLKVEDVYLKDYTSPIHAEEEVGKYFHFYNNQRPHQSLGYERPYEFYMRCKKITGAQIAEARVQ